LRAQGNGQEHLMRRIIVAVIAVSLALAITAASVSAATPTPTLSIDLVGMPASVAPGGDITYTIRAQRDPADLDPEFDFNTPTGTTLVSVTAGPGAHIDQAGLADETIVHGNDPAFATKVRGKAPQLRLGFAAS